MQLIQMKIFLVDTTFDGLIDGVIVFVAEPGSPTPFGLLIDGCLEALVDPLTFSVAASDVPQEVGSLEA